MTQRVWVVGQTEHDEFEIAGCFASEELARAYVALHEQATHHGADYTVEQHEVRDALPDEVLIYRAKGWVHLDSGELHDVSVAAEVIPRAQADAMPDLICTHDVVSLQDRQRIVKGPLVRLECKPRLSREDAEAALRGLADQAVASLVVVS